MSATDVTTTPPGIAIDVTGAGATLVVPEDLAAGGVRLRAAAADLAEATRRLAWACAAESLLAVWPDLPGALLAARAGALAAAVEDVASSVGGAARRYLQADSDAYRAGLGIGAGLPVLVGPLLVGPAVGAGAWLALNAAVGYAGLRVAESVTGDRGLTGSVTAAAVAELARDGRTAFLGGVLAGALETLGLAHGPAPADAARVLNQVADRWAGTPAPATLVPVPVRRLGVPTGLAGVVQAVDVAYHPQGDGTESDATIVVQRFDHADGTTSWLIAVPGTQDWSPDSAVPTDLSTNLEVVAGVPDQLTGAVLAAMSRAGVRPGDSAVFAGHSLGGMVAQRAAALSAGTVHVQAVVTIGSPQVVAPPAGATRYTLENWEDAVPQLDGTTTVPADPGTVVVRGDLSSLTGGEPTLGEAHSRPAYTVLGAAADAALAAHGHTEQGLAQCFGDVTATSTTAYQASRDPLVRTGAGPAQVVVPR